MSTLTEEQIYRALGSNLAWQSEIVTFSFPQTGSFWPSDFYVPVAPFTNPGSTNEPFSPGYGVLAQFQRTPFVDAIKAWDRLIKLDLKEVSDNGDGHGQIRVAFTDLNGFGPYAYGPSLLVGARDHRGDAWIDDGFKTSSAAPGQVLNQIFLHVIGEALGLQNTEYFGVNLPADLDSARYTVMSFRPFDSDVTVFSRQEGGNPGGLTTTVRPDGPMLFDIIAIQKMYGASGNLAMAGDTYVFDEKKGFLTTIVDNGGVDTFDLSANTRGSILDLTPGHYSSVAQFSVAAQIDYWKAQFPGFNSFITTVLDKPSTYTWTNNLATSPDTVIENVLAGSGADTITGNAANNMISAGAGADMVAAGAGNDTIDGGAGANYLRGDEGDDSISGGSGFDDINGNMGADTCIGAVGDDWVVGGKDNDSLSGGTGQNLVYGNLGNDTCDGGDNADIVRGGQDNDVVRGGAGDDFVSGDKGDDTMSGGSGADIFHTFGESNIDRVTDFNRADGDRVQLDPGTTYTVTQSGADTVISMTGGGQMILVGVAMSSLTGNWIFGA